MNVTRDSEGTLHVVLQCSGMWLWASSFHGVYVISPVVNEQCKSVETHRIGVQYPRQGARCSGAVAESNLTLCAQNSHDDDQSSSCPGERARDGDHPHRL